jgi:membrane protein required for beta-lactamase induction
MIFIITLIALLMERFFHWRHLRHWHWFKRYEQWLSVHIGQWPAILILFCNLLLPVAAVGIVGYLLSNILYGIPQFIFGVIIILYCLGPENVWLQTYRCINDLHKEDRAAALQEAHVFFGAQTSEHSQAFHRKFVHAIFVAAHQRIFAILFWFVILGPVGAVLYRIIGFYRTQSSSRLQPVSSQIGSWMDWLSIRLFTFLFALGGHFTKVIAHWKPSVLKGVKANDVLLTECGSAALDIVDGGVIPESGTAETEAIALLDRVFVMGLVILAVIVLVTSF